MDIYAILSSKPHNEHYLNRYIKFITACQHKNTIFSGYTEKHHICPKAKDMFPEYESFIAHRRNCAVLTARQHFIAHMMLWKCFPTVNSITYAAHSMSVYQNKKICSKLYQKLNEEFRKSQSERVANSKFTIEMGIGYNPNISTHVWPFFDAATHSSSWVFNSP